MIAALRRALSLGVAIAIAWTVGLFAFAASMPIVPQDRDTVTDAIVVWTGGADRVSTGLDLLSAGRAKKLFVSGVGRDVTLDAILRVSRPQPMDLRCCVALGRDAADTRGNAAETTSWIRGEGFTSLRLVTAAYHMQRALLALHASLPDARIVAHPVLPAGFEPARWWSVRESRNLVAAEYVKYLFAFLKAQLAA